MKKKLMLREKNVEPTLTSFTSSKCARPSYVARYVAYSERNLLLKPRVLYNFAQLQQDGRNELGSLPQPRSPEKNTGMNVY